jgi:hypothetical protein
LTYISAAAARGANFAAMDWQVHYQSGGRRFSAPAADRSTAIAIACILIRDGHEVVTLVSMSGETIEPEEIKRLCRC